MTSRLTVALVVVTLGVLYSAPGGQTKGVSEEDTLKHLSLDGEKLVNGEVQQALYGVKQMKEVMWMNEKKHKHLMMSLRHSSEKKKGAVELAQEVTEKLRYAEEQCKESLQAKWEECRPCLEDACRTFYTSNCRRGFSAFHAKVESFFHGVSKRFGLGQPRTDTGDILVNQGHEESDTDITQIESSFNRLVNMVDTLVNRSAAVVSRMRGKLDAVLQTAFLNRTTALMEKDTSDPFYPSRDSGFLQGLGLDELLDSFYDFSRSVMEEFGAAVTRMFDRQKEVVNEAKRKGKEIFPHFLQNRKLCRNLRKQTSDCWQLQNQCKACQGTLLTECPTVRELHVELDDISQLMDVVKEQYEDIRSIVQHHIDETVSWLSDMAAEHSWVAQVVTNDNTPENIFHVSMVAPNSQNEPEGETKVEVVILNLPPITISVPGQLELQDPAFIQYITQEGLNKYKEMVRYEDE
ncbi:clusterin-like protein 1 [Thalassophryne amazonica]|uniref:clusterin-like protein 1 n=1 Tax=Thalassophryne amazonica TaxID=390379 RepID=UPI0014725D98|nr:clusterin-like protein 1 [Thalassophryne amazonica]